MLSLILCCAALFTVSNALPGGAPAQACDNLTPGNPPHGVVEQAPPNPWIVDITGFDAVENSTTFTYNPGQTYTVTLRAVQQDSVTLRGFFIQGRTTMQNTMVGSFADPSGDNPTTRLSSCPTSEVGVTHNNGARMDLSGPFTFQWTAPEAGTGPVWFRYTIVETAQVWWADDPSAALQEAETGAAPQLQGFGLWTLLVVATATALKAVL